MPSLIQDFTMEDIDLKIDKFYQAKVRKSFEVLSWMGIQAVNYARQHGSYTDRTGNLRSSVAYAIIFDGQIKKSQFQGDDVGKGEARKLINELAAQFPQGMVLVIVAGMEYAAAVESKGYDVITGSSHFADTELIPFLKKRLGVAFL